MKIKKQDIISILLFLIGFFCQTSPLMSRGVMVGYLGFCLMLFIACINFRKRRFGIGFLWYLVFTIFCLVTLLYTINTINPDYVYIRIITYLALLFLASPFLTEENNVKKMVKGFIVGGLVGITIVLVNQYNLIGVKRLGGNLYGSYAEFGNVCMLTMASFIWLKEEFTKNKIFRFMLFIYISLAIILSGARKAILVSVLMFIFLQLLDKRKKITKKIVVVSALSILTILFITVSLNNKYLYDSVGYRIESGIASLIGEEKSDASLYERNSFKELAKYMIAEKPIFGWGIHGFAIMNYYEHNGLINFLLYSHDGFLEILSCYGILGFLLFYWIFIYIFIHYKKLLYDDVGIFLFSYAIIILLMEPYSISFLSSYYILIIGACANIITKRRNNSE